ncbi:hypothetical protein H8784_15725 [Parabacteroides acidifaciens]|uniref:Uncharacterized protein n=1 Tax=Parabacteroides acidifaciens TaxID=2290935 RepID=A0A3D8HBS5_9BACT|nr:hypothetical protein [Parabacteroides acidifaciens]MBC8603160.1 hypothetical protein [Parabacteroides acidifaciens]RDU48092.1 hypothetical protein DWU89_16115 [Parabacteroides acidifaciens]
MIKIGDNEYILKYTVRALFIYERITGLSFSPDKLINEYTLMYAILIANNNNFNLMFEDFISLCDENPGIFLEFRRWLLDTLKRLSLFQTENQDQDPDDKKKG